MSTAEALKPPETPDWQEMVAACDAAVGQVLESTDGKRVRVDNAYQAALTWWGRDRANWLAAQIWIDRTEAP